MKNEGQTSEDNMDSGILSSPLSLLRNGGYFSANTAGQSDRGGYGYYWSLRSANTTGSNALDFGNTYLGPQYGSNRGIGFAVRCVASSPNPSPLSLILAIL